MLEWLEQREHARHQLEKDHDPQSCPRRATEAIRRWRSLCLVADALAKKAGKGHIVVDACPGALASQEDQEGADASERECLLPETRQGVRGSEMRSRDSLAERRGACGERRRQWPCECCGIDWPVSALFSSDDNAAVMYSPVLTMASSIKSVASCARSAETSANSAAPVRPSLYLAVFFAPLTAVRMTAAPNSCAASASSEPLSLSEMASRA